MITMMTISKRIWNLHKIKQTKKKEREKEMKSNNERKKHKYTS